MEIWIDVKDKDVLLETKLVLSKKLNLKSAPLAVTKYGISKNKKAYLIKGHTKTTLDFNCDLCLGDVSLPIDFLWEKEILLLEEPVDIAPVLLTNICENIPMKILCNENCMGLCICGVDLNNAVCNCENVNREQSKFAALLKGLKFREV